MFQGNSDDRGVALARLDRMVSARFVRILPHDFQNGIYLRVELMGCADGIFSLSLHDILGVRKAVNCPNAYLKIISFLIFSIRA